MGEWIGGVVSLKLPFTLLHSKSDLESFGPPSSPYTPSRILEKIETIDDFNEDSLPFIDKDNTSDEDNQNDSPDKNPEEIVAECSTLSFPSISKSNDYNTG